MAKNKFTRKQIENMINFYEKGKSINNLAKLYNCAIRTICYHLEKYNIVKRPKGSFRKYFLNENYFNNINTEHKAYWLGYIFADGGIRPYKNIWELKITSKDKKILNEFKKDLKCKKPLYIDRNYYIIQINSKKLVNTLIRLGLKPNKCFIIKSPTYLKLDLVRHFVRGFFDGDGCIGYYHNNKNKNYFAGHFDICSGSYKFVKYLHNLLETELNLNQRKISKQGNAYSINYSSVKNLKDLYNYLYLNNSICLERKFLKFKQTLKVLNRQRKYR